MSFVRKRSTTINGHRTSFSLEQAFFDELVAIAGASGLSVAALVAHIDASRDPRVNLSSALRLHVLAQLKQPPGDQSSADPHILND